MKTPLIIFLLGLSGLVIADVFNQVRPMAALKAAPEAYPGARAFLDQVETVTDLSSASVTTQTMSCGYIDRVDVNPGFRIIHNPELGKEVVVTAPEGAIDFLRLSSHNGLFNPDFDRPVKLKSLVEVELNLQAHGSEFMSVLMSKPYRGRTVLLPDFVTKGPLAFTFLRLQHLPEHDILVAADKLLLTESRNLERLRGTANTLEFLYRGTEEAYNPAVDAPNVERQEVIRTPVFYDL